MKQEVQFKPIIVDKPYSEMVSEIMKIVEKNRYKMDVTESIENGQTTGITLNLRIQKR